MSVALKKLDIGELRPRITIFGVGGAGGNAVNNMINAGLQGVDFVVANTDAQALTASRAEFAAGRWRSCGHQPLGLMSC
jgi:cell division protein FtsZ